MLNGPHYILVATRSHFHAHAAPRLYLLALSTDAPFGILNLAWTHLKDCLETFSQYLYVLLACEYAITSLQLH